jgi:hypothetical protein
LFNNKTLKGCMMYVVASCRELSFLFSSEKEFVSTKCLLLAAEINVLCETFLNKNYFAFSTNWKHVN